MNSGHLSYRVNRVPWRQHWGLMFLCALVVFWLTWVVRLRVGIYDTSGPTSLGLLLRRDVSAEQIVGLPPGTEPRPVWVATGS